MAQGVVAAHRIGVMVRMARQVVDDDRHHSVNEDEPEPVEQRQSGRLGQQRAEDGQGGGNEAQQPQPALGAIDGIVPAGQKTLGVTYFFPRGNLNNRR